MQLCSLAGSKVSLHCQATPGPLGQLLPTGAVRAGLCCEGVLARESWAACGDAAWGDGTWGDAQGEKSRVWRGLGESGGLCWRDEARLDDSNGASVAAGCLDGASLGVAHSSSCRASSSSARALAWGVVVASGWATEQDCAGDVQVLALRLRLSACSFSRRLFFLVENATCGMWLAAAADADRTSTTSYTSESVINM